MINTKKTYTIKIAGKDYTLSTDDPPELVHRVAVYTDRKINEASAGGLIAKERATVFACLALAEELLSVQDDNTRLRRELYQLRSQDTESQGKI